ncbi:MAG: hypothetical protein E7214_07875 [Clostridium sp.]|nr:hypothetical protein [Clostridium sp.]
MISQYKDLNKAIKLISRYLVANKIAYYHEFSSIITNIVYSLNDPTLCFETNVFNSIIDNLGITNTLNISIEDLNFNDRLKDNYNIKI